MRRAPVGSRHETQTSTQHPITRALSTAAPTTRVLLTSKVEVLQLVHLAQCWDQTRCSGLPNAVACHTHTRCECSWSPHWTSAQHNRHISNGDNTLNANRE